MNTCDVISESRMYVRTHFAFENRYTSFTHKHADALSRHTGYLLCLLTCSALVQENMDETIVFTPELNEMK